MNRKVPAKPAKKLAAWQTTFFHPPMRLLSLPCYSPELVENSRRQHLESRLLLLARFCFQHRVIPQARIEKRVASLKVRGMKRVAGVEHDVTPRGQRAREDHYRYVLGRRICFAGQLNLLLRPFERQAIQDLADQQVRGRVAEQNQVSAGDI